MGDDKPDFSTLIDAELRFFTPEMRRAFESLAIDPVEVVQLWPYGPQQHRCWIVARNETYQVIYCRTGFGPSFPWYWQTRDATSLGTDGAADAYLVEAFAMCLWGGDLPPGFSYMGPGEREQEMQQSD